MTELNLAPLSSRGVENDIPLRDRLAELARDPAFFAAFEDGPGLIREAIAALAETGKGG